MEQLNPTSTGPKEEQELPSPRSGGLTVGTVFVILAIYWRSQPLVGGLLSVAGLTLIVLALFVPQRLRGLNRAWMKLAERIGAITNPVLIGVVFIVVLTPLGRLRRWVRGTTIATEIEPSKDSYWVRRDNSSLDPQTLKRQF